MYLQANGVTLPAKAQAGGNVAGVPSGFMNELLSTPLMPAYYTAAKLGKSFTAFAALQTLSVVGTAMTGLILWNSSTPGSGVDLVVTLAAADVAVTSATLTGVAIAYGRNQVTAPSTATAASAQFCDYIGNPLAAGLAYNIATMSVAPVSTWLVLHNTAAIAVTGEDPGQQIDFQGSIIVPPQQYVCFSALGAASAASAANLSLKWIEVPA
jgi:hypothetical protein